MIKLPSTSNVLFHYFFIVITFFSWHILSHLLPEIIFFWWDTRQKNLFYFIKVPRVQPTGNVSLHIKTYFYVKIVCHLFYMLFMCVCFMYKILNYFAFPCLFKTFIKKVLHYKWKYEIYKICNACYYFICVNLLTDV